MKVDGDWRTRPATQAVMRALSAKGNRVLFVGGCVRNAVLNEPVADVDLATDALPEEVLTLSRAGKLKAVPTGFDHGTVTVVSDGIPHEVTTFRRDVETYGRHATVAFSGRIEDDARRRDFTMNALYAEADGTLVDPLSGLDDARARRVRFIEDATQRIREDYLRILRFFRFHAWYGDPAAGIDAEGLAACAAELAGLDELSRERVGAEMLKLLAAPDPAPAVAAFASTGGLVRVLPGADARALPVLVELETQAGIEPDPFRRLACLGGEHLADRLRLSRDAARRLADVSAAIEHGEGAAAAGYRYGETVAIDAGLVSAARSGQPPEANLLSKAARGADMKFPIKAQDFMPDLEGPALGAKLKELEERWIASGFRQSRADLLKGDD